MNEVHLGLGGNLGERLGTLRSAVDALKSRGLALTRVSSIYDTEPVGFLEQGSFLNLVLAASWKGSPTELLAQCAEIEKGLGRVRGVRDGPRTVDIDILLWGEEIVSTESLEIPHPRMHLRRFVLVPLAEIAPQARHPILRLPVWELLDRCPDTSEVRKVAGPEAVDA